MKTLNSFLILAVLIAAAAYALSFTGCNNPITDSAAQKYPARTERDFVTNTSLLSQPGSVIITSLEDLNSPADTIPDTGTIGEDIIPIRYTQNAYRNISIGVATYIRVKLLDIYGNFIFELSDENPHIYANVPAGDYNMVITSRVNYYTDTLRGRQTLFIQPDVTAGTTSSDLNLLNTVIIGEMCVNCDLSYANLVNFKFTLANLTGSNLAGANLTLSKFLRGNLSYTNMQNAYFVGGKAENINFSFSNMKNTAFRYTDLNHSSFNNCDMSYADLRFADLSSADFCSAIKTGIISNGVTTNVETQCWP